MLPEIFTLIKKNLEYDLKKTDTLQTFIITIRGLQVILDRDLAVLYGVETRVLFACVLPLNDSLRQRGVVVV